MHDSSVDDTSFTKDPATSALPNLQTSPTPEKPEPSTLTKVPPDCGPKEGFKPKTNTCSVYS